MAGSRFLSTKVEEIPGLPSDEKRVTAPAPKFEKKTIWTVGGGKGGTGKSFISSCLAIHLASREEDVMAIDADLGAPNLHTFLGIKEADRDLGDFLNSRVAKLEEAAVPTSFPGLKLIKGSDRVLFLANLNHYKKRKLIRQIKTLEAQRVILDTGTGSSFNSLDFFILSNPGILVITPEPTSIENSYYFLKSCIIRILKLYIEYYRIQEAVKKLGEEMESGAQSIYGFFNTLISHDKTAARVLYRALKNFKPCLIINKARDEKDIILGQSIRSVARKYLVLDLNFLGAVPFDDKVHWCLKNFTPYLVKYPDSSVARTIKTIAERLTTVNP